MRKNNDSLETHESQTPRRMRMARALLFVVLWPTFNIALVASVTMQLGSFSLPGLLSTAAKLYATFAVAFVLIEALKNQFSGAIPEASFGRQLVLHMAVLILVSFIVSPIDPARTPPTLPQLRGVQQIFFLLQLLMYLALMRILEQQQRAHAMEMNLRQAQINLLRSQSNPHFLFNTLNLLGSEIKEHPDSAVDLVYDLADLLRESLLISEHPLTSVEQEFRLVRLYLQLQEKRFPGRLSFSIDVDDALLSEAIPSLLLQPAVENAIKHGVAKTTDPTCITLHASQSGNRLLISVENPVTEEPEYQMREGAGLRILRDTLELHYGGEHSMSFEISDGQAILKLALPLESERSNAS